MNLKHQLFILKEGLGVGAVWGLLSIYAAMGLATQADPLHLWQKILIAPVLLSGVILKGQLPSTWNIILPILLGAAGGAVFDFYYRPGE